MTSTMAAASTPRSPTHGSSGEATAAAGCTAAAGSVAASCGLMALPRNRDTHTGRGTDSCGRAKEGGQLHVMACGNGTAAGVSHQQSTSSGQKAP